MQVDRQVHTVVLHDDQISLLPEYCLIQEGGGRRQPSTTVCSRKSMAWWLFAERLQRTGTNNKQRVTSLYPYSARAIRTTLTWHAG